MIIFHDRLSKSNDVQSEADKPRKATELLKVRATLKHNSHLELKCKAQGKKKKTKFVYWSISASKQNYSNAMLN